MIPICGRRIWRRVVREGVRKSEIWLLFGAGVDFQQIFEGEERERGLVGGYIIGVTSLIGVEA